jgi:sporulation protein YlmC with PRC-barrel domain
MSVIRLARIVGTSSVILALSLVTAMAQTQSPPSSISPPAATKPESSVPPTTSPTTPAERKATAPAAAGSLVGLAVKSLDGTNLGTVQSVMTEPGGKTAIGIKVGGFLGFGGHMVAIPDGKFNRVGDTVQVNMTADEVNKLPKAEKQS